MEFENAIAEWFLSALIRSSNHTPCTSAELYMCEVYEWEWIYGKYPWVCTHTTCNAIVLYMYFIKLCWHIMLVKKIRWNLRGHWVHKTTGCIIGMQLSALQYGSDGIQFVLNRCWRFAAWVQLNVILTMICGCVQSYLWLAGCSECSTVSCSASVDLCLCHALESNISNIYCPWYLNCAATFSMIRLILSWFKGPSSLCIAYHECISIVLHLNCLIKICTKPSTPINHNIHPTTTGH